MIISGAKQYINRLNAEKFSGFNDWRLPTLEEAMSLMEPEVSDRVHINEVFERGGVNFIWTSDRTNDGRIFILYFYDGEIGLEPGGFNAWVLVVR